ncbi:MAG: hypothetical protein JSV10_03235 [Candidatus Zixiibacteriota bacterium]|nr:MAG: hypothetical protein JSV10_03235 [candidate division Zixibacteria bacterium]
MLCAAVALLICGTVQAQESGFGLGIIIGEPTGISGKQWTGSRTAIDGAVAWSFEDESALHLHGDLLYHSFTPPKINRGKFAWYYGIGGRIKFEDDSKVGVRVPLGMDYLLGTAPLDFFLELVPILDLAPSTDFSLNAAIGIRYFFGQEAYK